MKTSPILALPFLPSPPRCGVWLAGDRRGRSTRWKVAQKEVVFVLSAKGCLCQLPPGTDFCPLGWRLLHFGEDIQGKSQPHSMSAHPGVS